VLRGELRRIEEPHAAIHGMAHEVLRLAGGGQAEEGLRAIDRARAGVLVAVIEQFGRIRRALRDQQREIGVTVTLGGRRCLVIVDRAEAVAELERIPSAEDPTAEGPLKSELALGLAHWSGARQPVVLLDIDRVATFC